VKYSNSNKFPDFTEELPAEFIENFPNNIGLYVVGGALRDAILAEGCRPPIELDILITGVEEHKLLDILRCFGKARSVGKSFTVIKWYPHEQQSAIDVSLPARRNIALPGGCEFDPNMPVEEDLIQRDFTVDAMAFDLHTGELLDPFGGLCDLKNGVLRAVSENSLAADPVRCLRAAYVCAKCGLLPNEETLSLIKSAMKDLWKVAPERIGEELRKLLIRLERPSAAFLLWNDWGLLEIVLPELAEGIGVTQEGGWHAHDVFEHNLRTVDAAPLKLDVRLAALFHDVGKPKRRRYLIEEERATFYGHQNVSERMSKTALKRLRFSGEIIDRVGRLVRYHMFTHAQTDKGVRRFIRRIGEDILTELFELRYADIKAQGTDRDDSSDRQYETRVRAILDEKPPLSPRDLAVDGNDVMRLLNIEEGPEVGKVLNHLLELVLDDPSKNERESLIAAIHDFVAL